MTSSADTSIVVDIPQTVRTAEGCCDEGLEPINAPWIAEMRRHMLQDMRIDKNQEPIKNFRFTETKMGIVLFASLAFIFTILVYLGGMCVMGQCQTAGAIALVAIMLVITLSALAFTAYAIILWLQGEMVTTHRYQL